jgi:hypothetical protein
MMLGWQDWIVALIVVLCVGRVGLSLWRLYQKTRRGDDPCAHCTQPCDIKHQHQLKKDNHCPCNKKTKNSCCE